MKSPLVFILFVLVACTETHRQDTDAPLTMHVIAREITSRSGMEKNFLQNDEIGVYVCNRAEMHIAGDLSDTIEKWVDNHKLTCTAAGEWTGEEPLYWKDRTTVTDVFAYYPWQPLAVAAKVNVWPVRVAVNQSSDDSIRRSDFLWARTRGVAWQTYEGELLLDFQHRMVKLNINIDATAVDGPIEIESLTFQKLHTLAYIDLNTGQFLEGAYEPCEITPYLTSEHSHAAEVIIVPQTVEAGRLLTIVLRHSNNRKVYDYELNTETCFEAGKQYDLDITYTE